MNKYNVKLEKLGSVENPYIEPSAQHVKPQEVRELVTQNLPQEGQEFYAAYENKFRLFKTSTVKKIIENSNEKIIFETWNSRYQLEITSESNSNE